MKVMTQQTQLKDFVAIPRIHRENYLNGKLTLNEWHILVWILTGTNAYNGYISISYEGLVQDFKDKISYEQMRKIISSLRKKDYIYFLDHKGKSGSFPIYPVDFPLTSKRFQTLDSIKQKLLSPKVSEIEHPTQTKLENNLPPQNHNLYDLKKQVAKGFSTQSHYAKRTTPYTDTDNHPNTLNTDNRSSNKEEGAPTAKKYELKPVQGFIPKHNEEERCWVVANSVEEKYMNFILSAYYRSNLFLVEKAYTEFRDTPPNKIRNKPRYFNKIMTRLLKEHENK